VNGQVHALFQNCTVLGSVADAIAKPLKLANVTSLDTYLPTKEGETKVQLKKDDAELLEKAINAQGIISPKSVAVEAGRQVVWVSPKTGNYEGEPTSWSFRKIGDKTAFRAKLEDAEFLEKLKSGEVRLSGKDSLRVELVEVQDLVERKISRSIRRVIEYKPSPIQTYFGPHSQGPSNY
jgi:hypothetical protein